MKFVDPSDVNGVGGKLLSFEYSVAAFGDEVSA
jgi:hypothetical protein